MLGAVNGRSHLSALPGPCQVSVHVWAVLGVVERSVYFQETWIRVRREEGRPYDAKCLSVSPESLQLEVSRAVYKELRLWCCILASALSSFETLGTLAKPCLSFHISKMGMVIMVYSA